MRMKRYVLYLAVLLSVLLAYIPFRLLAERYNTVVDDTCDFVFFCAVFIWPAYIFLVSGSASLAGSLLRMHWILRIFVAALLVSWIDYSRYVDGIAGLDWQGRVGLTLARSPFVGVSNTTHLSKLLCVLTFAVGLLVGEVLGFILKLIANKSLQSRRRRA